MNHLQNVHYHLDLICAIYWEYFAMSLDTIRWHASSCEALTTTTKDKTLKEEEESESDNGNKNDRYLLEET